MRILKTSLFAFSQTVAKLFAGLVVVKIVAVVAGPEGIASFGVFQNLCTILLMLSGGVAATGITKIVSQTTINIDAAYRTSSVYTLRLGILSLVFVLPCLLISQEYFLEASPNEIFLLVVAGPLVFFQSRFNFSIAVLNGLEKVRELAMRNIFSSVVSVIFALVTYHFFRRWEVVALATVFGATITVFCYRSSLLRAIEFRAKNVSIDNGILRTLTKYSVVGGISAISIPLAQIAIRDFVADSISENAAGIWQGMTRLSEVYLVLISSALSIYIIPKASAANDKEQILKIVKSSLLFATASAVVGTISIFLFKDLIVRLVFDHRFYEMGSLFRYQLPGDCLKIISWVFAFTLLARGSLTTMVALEVISTLFYVLSAYVLIGHSGLDGAIVAYTLSYALYLCLTIVAFMRSIRSL